MSDSEMLPDDELEEDQNYPVEEEDIVTPTDLYSISSFGLDYPVEVLVSRINSKQFIIPEFQRNFVWSKNIASRFIESLLLGLPTPSLFLFQEPNSENYLIIDGQQRLMTLAHFYKGKFNKQRFTLSGIRDQWIGKTYNTLNDEDRKRLDNAGIRATIFKQDSPKNNLDSVYEVFERLNTGGLKLSSQEIRSCIYHGKFNDFLHHLNKNETWRKICGPESKRQRDIEFILRFFAFLEWEEKYSPPMKHFLNLYMEEKRNCSDEQLEELAEIFCKTIQYANSSLGPRPFRPEKGFNVAVFDSVATSIARSLKLGKRLTPEKSEQIYKSLLKDEIFKKGYIHSTADTENIKYRFGKAKEFFGVL
ncbi:MAG: DUF262 domain-containing protein [Rhodobacteraceae bacterium]|nr:DUF262 domain-containing protein [Paracoccaceae bacterium]